MLISTAYAQTGGGAGAGGFDIVALLPLVLIFVVFYFLLIRPQQKKMKEHQAMVNAVKRGDKVVTGGGIVATVTKVVSDAEVMVEIAEGVRVKVMKATLVNVLTRGEPQAARSPSSPANDQGGGKTRKGLLGGFSKPKSDQ